MNAGGAVFRPQLGRKVVVRFDIIFLALRSEPGNEDFGFHIIALSVLLGISYTICHISYFIFHISYFISNMKYGLSPISGAGRFYDVTLASLGRKNDQSRFRLFSLDYLAVRFDLDG